MKNKCPKTMTGKHIFKDIINITNFDYSSLSELVPEVIYISKCLACGMIDDREGKT